MGYKKNDLVWKKCKNIRREGKILKLESKEENRTKEIYLNTGKKYV